MGLQIFTDAAAFLERTERFLFRDEAANNLILSAASALIQNPRVGSPFFASYTANADHDAVTAAAVWIPGHKIVLSDGPEAAGAEFARALAERGPQVPKGLSGVLAPPSTGNAFLAECQNLLGCEIQLGLEQVIMRLDFGSLESTPTSPPKPVTPGRLRRAWLEDFNLLRGWAQAMVLELKLYESPQETAEIMRRAIEGRRFFVWDNGGPVAMFGHSGHTPHGARVNSVYVPPEKRRQGYAFAGVWRLSELLRQSGKSFACLFADRMNPGSIALYEKLGYRTIGALNETRFAPLTKS